MRSYLHPSCPLQALRIRLKAGFPLSTLALLATLAAPVQAAPVTYQITGTLQRSSTFGVNIESHIQTIGFDGGRFRATVTLHDSAADSDTRGTRGLYLGAVTASTLEVASTVFSHNNYCNLELNILDCSVEALNDHALAPNLFMDGWRLNSQVYRSAAVPGLPPYLSYMTFDLAAGSIFGSAGDLSRFDSTALDFGLERLGADMPGSFGLDLRGNNSNLSEEYGVFWRSTDLQVTRVLADTDPDPGQVPEPASAALALVALAASSLASAGTAASRRRRRD